MKRFVAFVVLALLVIVPVSQAAPKKISVKPMQLLTTIGTPEEVSGAVVSGKSIIVFGTRASKAYARAIDRAGKELWNLSLDQSAASIATAAAVDAGGFRPKASGVAPAIQISPAESTAADVATDAAD